MQERSFTVNFSRGLSNLWLVTKYDCIFYDIKGKISLSEV